MCFSSVFSSAAVTRVMQQCWQKHGLQDDLVYHPPPVGKLRMLQKCLRPKPATLHQQEMVTIMGVCGLSLRTPMLTHTAMRQYCRGLRRGLRTPVLTCHVARQYWGAADLTCELPCWHMPTLTQSRGVVAVTCGLLCRPKFKIPSLPPVQRRNPAQPEVCLAFVLDSTIASPDVPFFPSYTNLQ